MRSFLLFLILNNWSRWGWWMCQMDQQCFGSNASPKWACARCCVQVRWGWAQTWWSHAVGDAVWRQVSHHSVLWASSWNRSDHLPPWSWPGCPLPSALSTFPHSALQHCYSIHVECEDIKIWKINNSRCSLLTKVFRSLGSQCSHNRCATCFQLRGKTEQHFSSHSSFPAASVSRCFLLCPQLRVLHQPAETKRLLVCFH